MIPENYEEEYKLEGEKRRLCVKVKCFKCDEYFLKRKDHYLNKPDGPHYCCRTCHNESQKEDRYNDKGEKLCGGCNRYLSIDFFYGRSENGENLRSRCRECNDPRQHNL